MDATQFQVGYDTGGKVQFKYIATEGKKKKLEERPLKVLPNKNSAGITAYFIKYYMLMTAAGFAADPVYVLADNKFKNKEIPVGTQA
jgi:hypothetical protein